MKPDLAPLLWNYFARFSNYFESTYMLTGQRPINSERFIPF